MRKQVKELSKWKVTFISNCNPYCHTTIAHQISQKLAQKYYCLYLVLEKIGVLAYRLNLSASAAIHLVFHISQLKKHLGKHLGNHVTPSTLPCLTKENPFQERRMVKKGNRAATQILIHWKNQSPADAM